MLHRLGEGSEPLLVRVHLLLHLFGQVQDVPVSCVRKGVHDLKGKVSCLSSCFRVHQGTTATMRFRTPKTKVSKEPTKMMAVAGYSLSYVSDLSFKLFAKDHDDWDGDDTPAIASNYSLEEQQVGLHDRSRGLQAEGAVAEGAMGLLHVLKTKNRNRKAL